MSTLQEVYDQVLADEHGLSALVEIADDETAIAEFLAQHGCDATAEEARAFVNEKLSQAGNLAVEELACVVGGAECQYRPGEDQPFF